RVSIKTDYNWEMYNATNVGTNPDTYWDSTFKADLANECNTSYSSMPIVGERQLKQWRESLDSNWAIVCNRGVRDGLVDQTNYNTSVTLQIHGKKSWLGNICYNDNHVKPEKTFYPEGINYYNSGVATPDNIFKNENNGTP